MDFTTTYLVIGDLATAAGLSAFGFVVGPFVYIAHERAWEYFGGSGKPVAVPATRLLTFDPAPAAPLSAAAA
jgi:uncharacterized membrane protein